MFKTINKWRSQQLSLAPLSALAARSDSLSRAISWDTQSKIVIDRWSQSGKCGNSPPDCENQGNLILLDDFDVLQNFLVYLINFL
jgi:hypothetical protein